MTFRELNLNEQLLRALEVQGYTNPTPIQGKAIPQILNRKDVLGIAQTGTGKTAAFALPIIQLMADEPIPQKRAVRCLVLTPTRELALQVEASFADYGKFTNLRSCVIFGGVGQQPQVDQLRRGVDILIATPGRLLDLMQQGLLSLNAVKWLVLDEADRMLDMGFVHDVKRVIAAVPKQRQTLFFSATMPPDVADLSRSILHEPVRVEATPPSTTAEKINQQIYFVDKGNKRHLLKELLTKNAIERVLVFTRTKHGADKVARELSKSGIAAQAIHGNKSQNQRQAALTGFKSMKIRALVATDIAARGIDIDQLSHVIQFDLPNVPETYVHRIGRTGRAGAGGTAIAFCDSEERPYLKDIEKLTGIKIPVVSDHAWPLGTAPVKEPAEANTSSGHSRRPDQPRQGSNRRHGQQRQQQRSRPASGQQPKPEGQKTETRPNTARPVRLSNNLSRQLGRGGRGKDFLPPSDYSY